LDYIILADTNNKLCDNLTNIMPTRSNIINTLDSVKNGYNKFIIRDTDHLFLFILMMKKIEETRL